LHIYARQSEFWYSKADINYFTRWCSEEFEVRRDL